MARLPAGRGDGPSGAELVGEPVEKASRGPALVAGYLGCRGLYERFGNGVPDGRFLVREGSR
jgi:hypothetical protein